MAKRLGKYVLVHGFGSFFRSFFISLFFDSTWFSLQLLVNLFGSFCGSFLIESTSIRMALWCFLKYSTCFSRASILCRAMLDDSFFSLFHGFFCWFLLWLVSLVTSAHLERTVPLERFFRFLWLSLCCLSCWFVKKYLLWNNTKVIHYISFLFHKKTRIINIITNFHLFFTIFFVFQPLRIFLVCLITFCILCH